MFSNFGLVISLGTRNVWRNPRRSLITLLAIVIGIWSALSLAAFGRGLSLQMIDEAIFNLTGDVKVQHPAYRDDPVIDYLISKPERIEKFSIELNSIKQVASRVRVPGAVMSERETAGVEIVGIDPQQERGMSFIGEGVVEARMLDGPNDTGVVVGRKLLEKLQTKLNRRIVLMTESVDDSIADRGFRIVGVFEAKLEATEQTFVFVGRSVLQKLVGVEDSVTSISIGTAHENVEKVAALLTEEFPDEKTSTWKELEPLVVAMVNMQDGFLAIWYLIVVVAISFGLVNTLFMAVFERTRELGMLRALGMKPSGILLQIVFESLSLLVIGGLLGNGISYLTMWFFSGGIDLSSFASGLEMSGLSKIVFPKLVLGDVLAANATIFVVGVLSSLYPAWKAAKMKPVESLIGSH